MNGRVVRIGGASGFWGDSSLAPQQLVRGEERLDYLTFDYLAELTMSILSRARAKDSGAGYAEDFVTVAMRSVIRDVASRGIKVLSNAGGMNPQGCAKALRELAAQEGVDLNIAVVEGDDLLPSAAALRQRDVKDLHSGLALPGKIMSANAYLGALPIVEALKQGAQVVITGRCVDSALPLAALIHEFGWAVDDFDKLASGSLAGHLIECGPQATGGLFTDWEEVEGWENIGYPIVECYADGNFVVTKPIGTGGLVTPAVVSEQMLYEIGDPSAYLLPDVTCDYTAVRMSQDGEGRVKVEGARGRAPSNFYKVSATYADGWRCVVNVTLVGGRAELKAQRVATAILARSRHIMQEQGLADFRKTYMEILGTEALFGPHSRVQINREVILRLVVEHTDPKALDIFGSEIAAGGTSWAPGMTSIGGGRPRPSPIIRLFSFLWPKSELSVSVTVEKETTLVHIPIDLADAQHVDVSPSVYGEDTEFPTYTYVGPTVEVPLITLAHGRSGDKGDSVNIGVIARDPKWLPILRSKLTAERVQEYFAHLVLGPVTRFDVPGINGFDFLLLSALDGGGMASPRSDPLGKAFAQMLLDMPIEVPAELILNAEKVIQSDQIGGAKHGLYA